MDVPLPPDEIVTEAGLKERFNPVFEDVAVKVIMPENPRRLLRLMVVVFDVKP
jgi:hypothetical protein